MASSIPGSGSTTGGSTCTKIPSEMAGPYPGDGSNSANVLNERGSLVASLTVAV